MILKNIKMKKTLLPVPRSTFAIADSAWTPTITRNWRGIAARARNFASV